MIALEYDPVGRCRRIWAMIVKEIVQLRRDRVTLATMIAIPVFQLTLYGYAINTTPKHLPTALLVQETSDVGRSILAALQNTEYFTVTRQVYQVDMLDRLLASGEVLFAIEIPTGFERALRRGDHPALLAISDGTDPVAIASAMAALDGLVRSALKAAHAVPEASVEAFEIRQHRRYNPAGVSQLNIVPGLLGTILTTSMLVFAGLSLTREAERGTLESLLAMPVSPLEIMMGKVAPFVAVGFVQGVLVLAAGVVLFGVPILGSLALLGTLTVLFITANLSIGFTFSTFGQTQLQSMQMVMLFFLPNLLLSGFMFPFAGMPTWAQWISEGLPLTHYLRIVRAIMLKGSDFADLQADVLWLAALTLVAMAIAVASFRRTLD
ncbi:MAG TPA: ABC transporter permease [Xanthobacteraceae bacterium]|jgi:ABC-2 type transport system permease protein